jgi:hypothetical protein
MRSKPVVVIVLLALLGGIGAIVIAVNSLSGSLKLPKIGPACVVRADGEVTLDATQMANAATITAIGIRRKMPERAVVIALATAFQESKLENIEHGDRDSLGLFQQRPSQGWGTPEQVSDPRYAAAKFYAALKKVKGYDKMRVTDAAQRVQRSAYPEAYEKWADESAVLAKALMGRATGAVECTVSGEPVQRGAAAATALLDALRLDWGKGLAGVAGIKEAGLTFPVKDPSSGWRYAHWLVSHAGDSGLERVRFADLEWTAPEGKWVPVAADRAAGNTTVMAEVFS